MATFPTALPSFSNPVGTTLVDTGIDHAALHTSENNEIVAVATKIGISSSTPTANKVLLGSGAGTSGWSQTWNNGTLGTASLFGGTVGTALIGTSTLQGGTANNMVVNTSDLRGFYTTPQGTTVAAGGTATLDLNTSNEWRVTFGTGNATLALTNAVDGKKFIVSLTQDAVGTRTVTWFNTIKWAGSASPTLTTTASKRDTFGFISTGTATFDGFVVGQNL